MFSSGVKAFIELKINDRSNTWGDRADSEHHASDHFWNAFCQVGHHWYCHCEPRPWLENSKYVVEPPTRVFHKQVTCHCNCVEHNASWYEDLGGYIVWQPTTNHDKRYWENVGDQIKSLPEIFLFFFSENILFYERVHELWKCNLLNHGNVSRY